MGKNKTSQKHRKKVTNKTHQKDSFRCPKWDLIAGIPIESVGEIEKKPQKSIQTKSSKYKENGKTANIKSFEYEGDLYYWNEGKWLNADTTDVSESKKYGLNKHFGFKNTMIQSGKNSSAKSKQINNKNKFQNAGYDDAMFHRIPGDFYRG